MPAKYFDGMMGLRQLLFWAVATRLQLDRWEQLVADSLRSHLANELPGAVIWQVQIERHFVLTAARNLVRAVELGEVDVYLDATIKADVAEGRDLNEHWDENMPVFNEHPRNKEPRYRSGKAFAARNPTSGPYSWLAWDGREGPKLLPNVPAFAIHDFVDRVETTVLAQASATSAANLGAYLPPRQPSPWLGVSDGADRWWPRKRDALRQS